MLSDNRISLGISPCPNDTYIFYCLLHGWVDLQGLSLQVRFKDVQSLNQMACRQELDVVKLSVAAYPQVREHYHLLRAGGALGWGCGPLLVSRRPCSLDDLQQATIAVPGRMTTACKLLELMGWHQGQKLELDYSMIMPAVAKGHADAGLVIHEGRFTYSQQGLHLVLDLGQWWEEKTGLPLPLGIIACHKRLGREFVPWMEARIRSSLELVRAQPDLAWDFIRSKALEMDEGTILRHIEAFVTEYSYDLGSQGQKALDCLLQQDPAYEGSGPGPRA
ncbi:MAG: 1,4-dihydroxy-6-naphthoate synthase [Desulfohalobiaceae bacterium]